MQITHVAIDHPASIIALSDLFNSDGLSRVTVTYADGAQEELLTYYNTEITFTPEELIGLTREEALELRHKKTVAHIQS